MSISYAAFFFNDPATPEIYPLSLHDALPIFAVTLHVARTLGAGYATAGIVMAATTIGMTLGGPWRGRVVDRSGLRRALLPSIVVGGAAWFARSEEHTSELQ